MNEIIKGDGWSVGDLDALGEGPGFRKVRAALGVTAFGVNAVVLPPGLSTPTHFHERQQELYFVHRGRIEFTLDGEPHELGPGGFARVDAGTVRSVRNLSDTEEAIFVCVGGEGGYVGRDGRRPDA
jgi:quercetin dioxygenase-like cupin family protein